MVRGCDFDVPRFAVKMSSPWTSKFNIRRDLSLAQGYDVPASLEATVGINEKPPAPDIIEDTEQEYFGHWVGDGDISAAPDLGLIQQMLEMVRDTDICSDYEDEPDNVLQITKPCEQANTIQTNLEPKSINNNNIIGESVPKKIKRKRENVAVNSILEAIAGDIPIMNMENPSSEPLKLLKPTDFISTDKEIVNSLEKVNGWLNSQHKEPVNAKPSNKFLNWEPSSMFKRKSSSTVKSNESDSAKSSPQKVTPTASYRPSALADEYYQKYVERSKLKAMVNEDVWTRAERIMKEIDAKKKSQIEAITGIEAVEMSTSSKSTPVSSDNMEDVNNIGPEAVQLPQHRHGLAGPCAVCAALRARGLAPPRA